MAGHTLGLLELLLVFGGVIAWACWEIWSTRRSQGNRRADPPDSEPREPD